MQPDDKLDALLSHLFTGGEQSAALNGDGDDLEELEGTEDLKPLLAAASRLQPLHDAVPAPSFVSALESRLTTYAATLARANGADLGHQTLAAMPAEPASDTAALASDADTQVVPITHLTGKQDSRRQKRIQVTRRPRFLWPSVAAAVLLFAVGTLTVAADAGPGSPFYGLHRLEQTARVALSGTPADQVRLHLQFARDALAQTDAAARTGNAAGFSDALATLQAELTAATSELLNVPTGATRDALAEQLSSLQADAITHLQSDLPHVSWSQRLTTTGALAVLGAPVPRVVSAAIMRLHDTNTTGTHTWRVVVTGTGFLPGAQLLIDGQPAGSVLSISPDTLVATYMTGDGQPPATVGVANPDDAAAQTGQVTVDPPDQPGGAPSPSSTPGNGSGGSGKGGHGGGHGGTPPPTPVPHPNPSPSGG